jgi:hypothetical protein
MRHATVEATEKKLNFFERYLSLWVAACMIVGNLLGKLVPAQLFCAPKVYGRQEHPSPRADWASGVPPESTW